MVIKRREGCEERNAVLHVVKGKATMDPAGLRHRRRRLRAARLVLLSLSFGTSSITRTREREPEGTATGDLYVSKDAFWPTVVLAPLIQRLARDHPDKSSQVNGDAN